MEYVIPYLRIDELRDLSHTCKEYKEMIDYYLSTKKKHTVSGYFDQLDFHWLMSKMKSLTHLTFDINLVTSARMCDLPETLETLIIKEMVTIEWFEDTGRIKRYIPWGLTYLHENSPRCKDKVFPNLKYVEIQLISKIGVICLYNPLVDGYDEYGPKYDYTEDYVETDLFADTELFTDTIDSASFYSTYSIQGREDFHLPKDMFPALEHYILPKANQNPRPLLVKELEALPWPTYNQAVPVSDPIISM